GAGTAHPGGRPVAGAGTPAPQPAALIRARFRPRHGWLSTGAAAAALRYGVRPGGSIQMADPLHVIVLAAGEGKRMKSLLPKVLMPLAGKPLLAHVLESA